MLYDNELGEFQPIPGYRDRFRSPIEITRATDYILGLIQANVLPNTVDARSFLNEEIMRFLKNARQAGKFYQEGVEFEENVDLESREAFGLAMVTFGQMKNLLIPGTNLTFSRRGMFEAPEKPAEAIERIDEMGVVIRRIVRSGIVPIRLTDATPAQFRTIKFFEAAHSIPFRQEPN